MSLRGASRHRPALVGVLVAFGLALAGALAGAEEETLPVLRRRLLEAHEDEAIGYALDKLQARIGAGDLFEDHAAFGDWLGELPDGRSEHPLVRLRRGWAYVRAKRGAEAIPHLEVGLKDNPADGLRRAYLGEALRQAGRLDEAAAMLITAAEVGHRGAHLEESFRNTVYGLRTSRIAGHADNLPDYVLVIQGWLEIRPTAAWHFSLARSLLDDMAIYEKPDRDRGKEWAEVAGRHALQALDQAASTFEGADKLAYDAAVALAVLDGQRAGDTDRFDLLVWVYRLGTIPAEDSHRYPQVITWLAEAAEREGRFELAFRLAMRRLEVSQSPRAKRLLMRLPPDLEIE